MRAELTTLLVLAAAAAGCECPGTTDVQGRVVDQDGSPIEGAEISDCSYYDGPEAPCLRVRSDATGQFAGEVFYSSSCDRSWPVTVTAEGCEGRTVELDLRWWSRRTFRHHVGTITLTCDEG